MVEIDEQIGSTQVALTEVEATLALNLRDIAMQRTVIYLEEKLHRLQLQLHAQKKRLKEFSKDSAMAAAFRTSSISGSIQESIAKDEDGEEEDDGQQQ